MNEDICHTRDGKAELLLAYFLMTNKSEF